MKEYKIMNGNPAYQEESKEELHNGEIVMIPGPSANHNRVASHIYYNTTRMKYTTFQMTT